MARRARGRGRAPRDPLRLGDAGARGRGVRARVRRRRRRAARLRRLELHDRAAPGAARRRRRARRRGRHRQPLVHRHRQRHPLLRRHAGVRRRRRPTPSTSIRRCVEAAISPIARRRILVVHQLGMPCDLAPILAIAAAPRPAGDRGRGLRHRQRDPLGRTSGSASAGRTATSPASRSTRASCSPPATAAC